MFIFGLLNGCSDIALFTVRQRRTDPAWMGRAFAVSMAFNFAGFPIGAAIAGAFVSGSLGMVVVAAVVACFVGTVLAAVLVPRTGQTFAAATLVGGSGGSAVAVAPEVGSEIALDVSG
jgi:hypothetical protein